MTHTDCTVTVEFDGKTISVTVPDGVTILHALGKIPDLSFDAPCGGKGTCGKCRIRVLDGDVSEPTPVEERFLSENETGDGVRLACMTRIRGDVRVECGSSYRGARIQTEYAEFVGDLDPVVKKTAYTLPPPSLEDQRDDLQRIADMVEVPRPQISLPLLRSFSGAVHAGDGIVTVTRSGDTVLAVEEGDTATVNFGIAVDIGTTTVVAYLLDLQEGEVVDAVSGLNAQKPFGGDVISRIEYCGRERDGLEFLQEKIVSQVGRMSAELCSRNELSSENIYSLKIAGNTTMLHLFAGLDPVHIATSPFIPVTTDLMVYSAESLGFRDLPNCTVFVLPSVSGYVGADIVSGVMATRMYSDEKLSLLVDIGTNGEIVLGNTEWLVCCSTAAGPAFEGAQISCGVGGIEGAVNTVYLDGSLKYTTIGNAPPIGICGSGIIDVAALLIETGAADYTGRIVDMDEAPSDQARTVLAGRFELDGESAIRITPAGDGGNGSGGEQGLYFTQKDLREVQLAKAAIAAGISTLLKETGTRVEEISNAYIAGGFGSYISKPSALGIGLLPRELEEKIKTVGNSAGMGAIMASLDKRNLQDCSHIREEARYFELSGNAVFQDEYIMAMYFPEPVESGA